MSANINELLLYLVRIKELYFILKTKYIYSPVLNYTDNRNFIRKNINKSNIRGLKKKIERKIRNINLNLQKTERKV